MRLIYFVLICTTRYIDVAVYSRYGMVVLHYIRDRIFICLTVKILLLNNFWTKVTIDVWDGAGLGTGCIHLADFRTISLRPNCEHLRLELAIEGMYMKRKQGKVMGILCGIIACNYTF